jgi:hypothetical protein
MDIYMENSVTPSKTIYHYCKLSTAIEYILPNKQLLLNSAGKTNDPRENKSFVFALKNISTNNYFDSAKHNDEVSSALRKDCKVLCLSSDHGTYFGYEYSRLWALYGENHKGVCIGLNRELFVKENQSVLKAGYFKKVIYNRLEEARRLPHKEFDLERNELLGQKTYLNEFRNENIDHLFFTKNEEWESEQEYRMILFSKKKQNEYCSIQKSLTGIYLGVDFSEVYLPSIKALTNETPIYKLQYKDVRLAAYLV